MGLKNWIAVNVLGIDPATIAKAENKATLEAAETIIPDFADQVNEAALSGRTQILDGRDMVAKGQTEIRNGSTKLGYAQRLGSNVTTDVPQPK